MNIIEVSEPITAIEENDLIFEAIDDNRTAIHWHCAARAKQALRQEVWGLKCVKQLTMPSTEQNVFTNWYPAVFKNSDRMKVEKAVERAIANPYR